MCVHVLVCIQYRMYGAKKKFSVLIQYPLFLYFFNL